MAIKRYDKSKNIRLSKNFMLSEFACKGSSCCTAVMLDSKLVEYIQKIRDHFNKPVTINSGYRCPAHNKRVGGATGSYHVKGMAADISVKDTPPREVAKYAESIGIKGIGLYETDEDGWFVHIDTRTTKSFWYGQAQVYRSTFGGATTTKANKGECTVNLPILQRGSKGNSVKALQHLLIDYGYSCGSYGADGDFGYATVSAVKAYQKKMGLIADGVVGANTWKKLLGIN